MSGIGSAARSAPDKTAIIEGTKATTFGQLERRSAALGGSLRAGGLGIGDRIAIYSANRTEVLEVATSALRAGIVPVPINSLLTWPEVNYILEDSGAEWLFTDRSIDVPASVHRVTTFGDAYERELHVATAAPLEDVTLTRPMHYTSGTTGRPKGVWVKPNRLERAAKISEWFIRSWGLNDEDVHLVCSPLSHSAPLRYSIRTLEAGGVVVVQRKFDPAETLAAIEIFSVTSTFMVPTHLERILALDPSTLRRHDLSSMRLLAHAGAPIRDETKRATIKLFPEGSVWEFYGATEGAGTRISPAEWLEHPGSVGRAYPGGRITITDRDGNEVEPGTTGVVMIDVPTNERFEYWGDEGKTRAAWKHRAFTVGDLGYVDDDGYLYLTGRLHDTIISGGVNVYPREIEVVLNEHPAVLEAAVYGSPHDEWGQEVRALVVPTPGLPLDPEHLHRWARERLAGFKCPRHFEVVDELPRTATGKIVRRPLDG